MTLLILLLLGMAGYGYLMAAARRARDRQLGRLDARRELASQARGDALKAHVRALPDFRFTHCLFSRDYSSAVALEEITGRVCLLDAAGPGIFHRIYPASDLLAVTLAEQEHAEPDVRPGGVGPLLAGTLVGDLLLGPVGAVLGGLWWARQEATVTPRAASLELQLRVNDTRAPLWRVRFLLEPTPESSPTYRKAREAALQWQALLQVVIHRGRPEASAQAGGTPPTLPARSV